MAVRSGRYSGAVGRGRRPVANAEIDTAMHDDAVAKSLARLGAGVGSEVAKSVPLLRAAGVVAE
jgi:hypothetical protein